MDIVKITKENDINQVDITAFVRDGKECRSLVRFSVADASRLSVDTEKLVMH